MDDFPMPTDAAPASETPRCPINVAARRSGLSAHVIRAWERRYSAITPDRTAKARRLYSDWEVRRLVLLRQAVELGHRIGEIARLPVEELRALVGRDALPGVEASPRIPLPRSRLHEVAMEAVRNLDASAFTQALLQATRLLTVPELFDDFVDPLAREIRLKVSDQRLRLAHERFAGAYLRSYLGDLLAVGGSGDGGGGLIAATPVGHDHELCALMGAVTASRAGWEVTYAGAALPVEELLAIAHLRGARALLLGLAPDGPSPDAEIARLRQELGEALPIFCCSLHLSATTGAHCPAGQAELLRRLGELRRH